MEIRPSFMDEFHTGTYIVHEHESQQDWTSLSTLSLFPSRCTLHLSLIYLLSLVLERCQHWPVSVARIPSSLERPLAWELWQTPENHTSSWPCMLHTLQVVLPTSKENRQSIPSTYTCRSKWSTWSKLINLCTISYLSIDSDFVVSRFQSDPHDHQH